MCAIFEKHDKTEGEEHKKDEPKKAAQQSHVRDRNLLLR
jgi:hypothetical protein